jgi:membrane dipeptidase
MMDSKPLPIFDGHNDTLLYLVEHDPDHGAQFLKRDDSRGHIDLPRAREGGFAGGMFAVYVGNPPEDGSFGDRLTRDEHGYEVKLPPPVAFDRAVKIALTQMSLLFRLEAMSEGAIKVIRSAAELEACLRDGVLAAVLHMEGAEAIDPDLAALEVCYQAGLRSLGPVWSRPNAFGHGVPFKHPSTSDTGPGLTDAGKALVKACNRLGIVVDNAHLNAKGFWDVAALTDVPLVVSHSGAYGICPSARNLTDDQIDALGESGGVIGISFYVADLRPDGYFEADTPLSTIVEHLRYIADRIGVAHVALGSDFNGARIPRAIKDVTGLPKLLDALRASGFAEADLRLVAHENWLRVLRKTWK